MAEQEGVIGSALTKSARDWKFGTQVRHAACSGNGYWISHVANFKKRRARIENG